MRYLVNSVHQVFNTAIPRACITIKYSKNNEIIAARVAKFFNETKLQLFVPCEYIVEFLLVIGQSQRQGHSVTGNDNHRRTNLAGQIKGRSLTGDRPLFRVMKNMNQ